MKTEILCDKSEIDVNKAAQYLNNGGLVCFATETVYGLGANALDGKACLKIYSAKGRAADNPLIVHISEIDELDRLVECVPNKARVLAEKYWPGPLTLIMKKSDLVPNSGYWATDNIHYYYHPSRS